MPALAFKPDPKWEKDFDKYYYFNRADTSFAEALTDPRQCDGLSRGLASPFGNSDVAYPYNSTAPGLVGGAIACMQAVGRPHNAALGISAKSVQCGGPTSHFPLAEPPGF